MTQRYVAAVANPFVGNIPGKADMGLCEICRNPVHDPHYFPLLQKYSSTAVVVHCHFCTVNTHRTEDCHPLSVLIERFYNNLFAVESVRTGNRGQNKNKYNQALRNDANHPPPRCYNCNEVGHIALNCPQPRQPCCSRCRKIGHNTKDCPELIEKWEAQDRRQHNVDMVSSKPLILSGDLMGRAYTNINIRHY